MTTLTHTLAPSTASGHKGFGAGLFGKLAAYRNAAKTLKALDALSDRELADIGLERGDIADVAYGRLTRA
ncbi:DUF1127 domain-containing protein [Celeribacter persicus]|jgi:Uncharacterized conserved small protein|uniref:Uncharacterized protein YjiS (DUF1127 family) n=1 Tax=Celeribacter persicus TaxID=1651082 RepID=A0A2T5H7J4_9RHOB|nr:DUF1127 domain-containing protein [Celeribacter persicus]PTQ67561.1 uncharacterized protein YjiS (DUF1127 family) [Celeribacter persicus]